MYESVYPVIASTGILDLPKNPLIDLAFFVVEDDFDGKRFVICQNRSANILEVSLYVNQSTCSLLLNKIGYEKLSQALIRECMEALCQKFRLKAEGLLAWPKLSSENLIEDDVAVSEDLNEEVQLHIPLTEAASTDFVKAVDDFDAVLKELDLGAWDGEEFGKGIRTYFFRGANGKLIFESLRKYRARFPNGSTVEILSDGKRLHLPLGE